MTKADKKKHTRTAAILVVILLSIVLAVKCGWIDLSKFR